MSPALKRSQADKDLRAMRRHSKSDVWASQRHKQLKDFPSKKFKFKALSEFF